MTNTSLTGGTDTGVDQLSGIETASLSGGSGNDVIRASAFTLGPVTLSGGYGKDTLYGGTRGDLLLGGDSKDVLTGGAGDDTLAGNRGNDSLTGGAGTDTVWDGVMAGEGAVLTTNRLRVNTQFGPDVDTLVSIERGVLQVYGVELAVSSLNAAKFKAGPVTLIGGSGNDLLVGTNRAGDSLVGGAGRDTLDSGLGADVVDGGDGTDVYLTALGSGLGDTVANVP